MLIQGFEPPSKNNTKSVLLISKAPTDWLIPLNSPQTRSLVILKKEQVERPNAKQKSLLRSIRHIIIDARFFDEDTLHKMVDAYKKTFELLGLHIIDTLERKNLTTFLKKEFSAKIIAYTPYKKRVHSYYAIQHGKRIDALLTFLNTLQIKKNHKKVLINVSFEKREEVEHALKENAFDSHVILKEYEELENYKGIGVDHVVCFECPKRLEDYGLLFDIAGALTAHIHILYDKTREREDLEKLQQSIPEIFEAQSLTQVSFLNRKKMKKEEKSNTQTPSQKERVATVSKEVVKKKQSTASSGGVTYTRRNRKMSPNRGFQRFVPDFLHFTLLVQ
jgi:hypothetical protein